MAKALDEKGFTEFALERGWSQDQVDTAINNYKAQSDLFTGLVEKYGDKIPTVMAIAGAIGGAILTAPAFGTGAFPGAAIGYGGGKAAENSLKDLIGIKSTNSDPTQGAPAIGDTALKSLMFGSGAAMVGSGAEMGAQSLSSPDMRESVISNLPEEQQNMSKADVETKINEFTDNAVNKNDPAVQKMKSELMDSLFQEQKPEGKASTTDLTETSYAKDKVHLNDFYDSLKSWEGKYKAYNDSGRPVTTGTSGVASNISSSLRNFANETGGDSLKMVNQLMSGKISAENGVSLMDNIKKIGAYGARFLAFRLAYKAITGSSSQKKTW